MSGLANFNLSMVVARRIPLVDEEAQMVLGMAVFIRRPGSPTPRNVFSEWFNVEEGRIRTIYTAMFYPVPELAVPNWPPSGELAAAGVDRARAGAAAPLRRFAAQRRLSSHALKAGPSVGARVFA